MEERDQAPTSSSRRIVRAADTYNVEFDETRSRYKTKLHVSKHYFGAIIGRHGSVKSSIEKETAAYIQIPPRWQESDHIIILGLTQTAIIAATNMVEEIVVTTRLRRKCTHFIGIPMNSPEIVKKFEEFKTAVLNDCAGSRGLDEILFKNPTKLHITVGVMCLMDNEEILHASKLLNDATKKIVLPLLEGHLPLKIKLKGLSYFCHNEHDDPTAMNVLYGTVEEEGDVKGLIQQLANGLVNYFHEAGYVNRKYDYVRLHVTFMNSKFITRADSANGNDTGLIKQSEKRSFTFDGSEVLKKFSDYDFGVMELKDIHLSKISSMGPDGFYETEMIASVASCI